MGPLQGLLVADFSRVLAGPLASMMLGDLGADVVKIEHPVTGDETREWGPPFVHGESSYYLGVNRNKLSIALDLGEAKDQEIARRLAVRADVLIENFRPGTMEGFALGYDTLAEINPGLVYGSLTGFGSGAPPSLAGYDLLVQAVGGLMSITGEPDGAETKTGVAVCDVLAGVHLALGVLAALLSRTQTGRGQKVEVNLMSSLLFSLVNQASTYLTTGRVPGRLGNAHPTIAPYQTVRTSDGSFALAVGNDTQFARFCAALGNATLADDHRFRTNGQRVLNREALIAEIESLLAGGTTQYWTATLQDAGIPAGPVNDIAAAFSLASVLDLDPVVELASSEGRVIPTVAHPIRFGETPPTYRRPPPRLGEDRSEVISRFLS